MLILTIYDSSKGITALEGQQVWSLFQTTRSRKTENFGEVIRWLNSFRRDLYYLGHQPVFNPCLTSPTRSTDLHLINQQHEQMFCYSGRKFTTMMVVRQQRTAKNRMAALLRVGGGGYTPNNRCRPEAPLTSLTKLTPVKSDENRKGEGERRNKTRFKKKS